MPWNGIGPQTLQVGRFLLAVDELEVMLQQKLVQMIEGYLGGVAHGVEHRLAEEGLADGDAVQTTHQLAI